MTLQDLKIFLWYLCTEPVRNLRESARDLVSGAKKDMQNIRLWSQFMIFMSLAILMLKDKPTAVLFFGIGVFLFLVYEWKRKYYRYRWNQRKINKILTAKPKDIDEKRKKNDE